MKRFFLFVVLSLFLFIYKEKASAKSTVLNCSGKIPKNTSCLIKASKYQIDILRIDICKNNPFPYFRSTPDYSGNKCISILNEKNNFNTRGKLNFKVALKKENIKDEGNYKYLSIILKNKFKASGKFISGNSKWITSKKGPKNILLIKEDNLTPELFTEKLFNWRGKDNLDNKYCENDGGTFSRCDLQYNGNRSVGIGLDASYIESYGENIKYFFYMNELSPPIYLSKNSEGNFKIIISKSLEVYGDGKIIKSISIAPFLFKGFYEKN